MKRVYTALLILLTHNGYAQTKIGNKNTGIEPSAALELSASDKALTLPYVPLTATNDLLTVPNPKKGMIVYSTLTGDKTLGDRRVFADQKYFFNGTIWQLLVDKTALGNLGIPGVVALGKQIEKCSMGLINNYFVEFADRDDAVNLDGSITAKKPGYYMYASRLVWKTAKIPIPTSNPIFNNPASRVSFLFQNPTDNPTTNATSHALSYSGLVYLKLNETSKAFSIAYGGSVVGDINDEVESAEVVWIYLGDTLN